MYIGNKNIIFRTRSLISMMIVIVVAFVSDDTVLFGTNSNYNFIALKYGVISALLSLLLLLYFAKSLKLNKKIIGINYIMILLIILSGFINNDLRLGYFYKSGILVVSTLLVSYIPFYKFAVLFDKIMRVISIASLVGFISYFLMKGALVYFPTIQNTANMEFYNLVLTVVPSSFHGGMARNYGIFREPAVYQTYLIIAMIFQLFIMPRVRMSSCILYIISIITTFSTTGYVALFILLLSYFIKRTENAGQFWQKTFVVIFFMLTISYMALYTDLLFQEGYGSVFGKLYDGGRSTTGARLASVFVNLNLFFKSPFLGVGLTQLEVQFPQIAYQYVGMLTPHNTNTMLIQFASHGFFYGMLWINGFWKLCNRITLARISAFMIFIVFNVLFIGSNVTFSLITNILLMYGYNSQLISNNKDNA